MGIQEGRFLYRDIWDNKPPFLYLLYAVFNGDQFTLRFISFLFGITAVIFFYVLAKRLLTQRIASITTVLFAILFGLPLLEGNIANAENFMLPIILLAALFVVSYTHRQKRNMLFLAGGLLSCAFLFKVVGLFDFSAFLFFLCMYSFHGVEKIGKQIRLLTPFIISFIAPIVFVAFFFFVMGAFGEFYAASFGQNIGYVGYGNAFIISQGFLLFKVLLLGAFILILFLKRRLISTTTLFILLWLGFSLFNAFFSQRPYTHYLLVLVPSFSLFVGLVLYWYSTHQKKYFKIGLLSLVILIIVLYRNFWIYEKIGPYYANVTMFLLNKKSVNAYQQFFDKKTPGDYAVASYISLHTKPTDNIFIWGNNAQIYKLTNKLPPGKYTVAYHVMSSKKNLEETYKAVISKRPKFIIVSSDTKKLPFLLPDYALRVTIHQLLIYERIY